MKNTIKNLVLTGIITSVFMLSATAAHAGLLISDRSSSDQTCLAGESAADGLSYTSLALEFTGLLISDRSGIIIIDRAGLLITDRAGLLITDRSELLISDKSAAPTCP